MVKQMKCRKPDFINAEMHMREKAAEEGRPELPDKLTDYLTGKEIAFSNRDNIRQKIVKFLIEIKGYLKSDLSVDRKIRYALDEQQMFSLVDISVNLDGTTYIIWKCASGSLVTRERQIIAQSRLLGDYVVPYAAVTNGKDLELLETSSERVILTGFKVFPSRQEFIEMAQDISFKPVNRKKIIYEQRILYTYDAMCSPENYQK
jgi:hypothetical protein